MFYYTKGHGGKEAAFTIKYDEHVRVLRSEAEVRLPHLPGEQPPRFMKCQAIWDTGATISGITAKVVKDLDLKLIRATNVWGVAGKCSTNEYIVDIRLPCGVLISFVHVFKMVFPPVPGNDDVLIGMDIIGRGDFAVTHSKKNTVLSFRVPSGRRTIDFVPDMQFKNQFPDQRT